MGHPPCLTQSPRACALVVQPGCTHTPFVLPPCLKQSPRAFALVVQPGWTHTDRVSPPCLPQSPRAFALVVQPGWTHTARASPPCLPQSPRPCALVAHPGTVHNPLAPCLLQRCDLFTAMVVQSPIRHIPYAPCRMHAPLTTTCLGHPSIMQILFFLGPAGFFCAAAPPTSPSFSAGWFIFALFFCRDSCHRFSLL